MKKSTFIIAFLLVFQMAISQIHVGPSQTYATIAAATNANAIGPGDTVYVHAGVYTTGGWIGNLVGTPSQWITIRPYLNDSVSIQVETDISVAKYVKITGLNFYGNNPATSASVFHLLFFGTGSTSSTCYMNVHDIIVDNCKFTNLNNTGKSSSTGANLKIINTARVKVTNCLFKNGTNITDGISFNGCRDGEVSNCRFEKLGAGADGSHCKGGAKKITYKRNLFIDCDACGLDIGGCTGTAFFCPTYSSTSFEADSCEVYSNIFIRGKTPIKLSSAWNTRVYNNTSFKATTFAFRTLNASCNPIYNKTNHIYNNIFTTNSTNGIYMNASASYTYNTHYFKNNLFHNYKQANPTAIGWAEYPGVNVSGTLIGDPKFNDTLNWNFSLLAGSPAIASGTNVSTPTNDYNNSLFNIPARSRGAIEYAGITNINATNFEDANNVNIYPNPSNGEFTIGWSGAGTIRTIEVYNILGKLMLQESPTGYNPKVDLSEMGKGAYKIVLRSNTGSLVSRTVIVE